MFVMRRLLSRRTGAARDERGAAMVLVAVALPVLVLFVAFGVEVGHWYDYSRNLQNRADAAAMAAAVQYGGTCFGSATTAPGRCHRQGRSAVRRPTERRHHGRKSPVRRTRARYRNQPNLTKGEPGNFHMLLNSTQYWPSGANWSMGTAGHTGTARPSAARTTRTETSGDGRRASHAGKPRTLFPTVRIQSRRSALTRAPRSRVRPAPMRLQSLSAIAAKSPASPSGWSTPPPTR